MSRAANESPHAESGLGVIITLIVDDSPRWVQALRNYLDQHPVFRVVGVAEDGREALTMIASCRPALVLLDVHLPHLSGLEVVPIIRESHPEVIVVMMTANPSPELEERCRAGGAHAFVAKSQVRQALLSAVHTFFPEVQA